MSLALREAAQGVFHAHLERCTEPPGAGHADILLASDAATRFLKGARVQVRADLALHCAARVLPAGGASPLDAEEVYLLTLARKLGSYERAQQRSTLGRTRTYHGVLAMAVVGASDLIIRPDVPAAVWAKRSQYTARVIRLGWHLRTLAAKAHQYGRRLLPGQEQFTTGGCPHCGLFERRGSTLYVVCSGCGLASHRDGGMAPNGIWKRALIHGAEARAGLLAAAGGAGPAVVRPAAAAGAAGGAGGAT